MRRKIGTVISNHDCCGCLDIEFDDRPGIDLSLNFKCNECGCNSGYVNLLGIPTKDMTALIKKLVEALEVNA